MRGARNELSYARATLLVRDLRSCGERSGSTVASMALPGRASSQQKISCRDTTLPELQRDSEGQRSRVSGLSKVAFMS